MLSNELLTTCARSYLRPLASPDLVARVSVFWSNRLKSCAGKAHYSQRLVKLNPRLLKHTGEVTRTLKHELAHLLARDRARIAGVRIQSHGAEWKQACADLGIPGELRCHSLNLRK